MLMEGQLIQNTTEDSHFDIMKWEIRVAGEQTGVKRGRLEI